MDRLINRLKRGEVPDYLVKISSQEKIVLDQITSDIVDGYTVVPRNTQRKNIDPCAIGKSLKTKVNANIGTSQSYPELSCELEKLRSAEQGGADTVMDLSTGGDMDEIRQRIIGGTKLPIGSVPIYQAAAKAIRQRGGVVNMTADDMFEAIEKHCKDGIDFITVHCGVTIASIDALRTDERITDVVSRGGAFLTAWILHNERENPLYEEYDRLLDIAGKYDVTISLGDGMRPGCGADASDSAQISELIVLGELVKRSRDAGVQVMVEGPGHMPINQITTNVAMEKSICNGAPFYVLGPLVTDIAPGYDEITAAIGGAIAAASGADFLCYVTPREHLGLPTPKDVHRGVIASRIAAHAADLIKDVPGAAEWDIAMSKSRKELDWMKQIALSIDPARAKKLHDERQTEDLETCTMCGDLCAMKVVSEYLDVQTIETC